GYPGPAEPAGGHTLIPAHWLRSAERECAATCAPAAAAWPASRALQDRTRGRPPEARSLHRDGQGRHWRGAAAATGAPSDAPPPAHRGPGESRPGPASAGPRISACAVRAPAAARRPAE